MAERKSKTKTHSRKPETDVNIRLRARHALQLATAGYDWQSIAEQAGYASRGAAHNAVQRELVRLGNPVAEEYRALAQSRLDALLQAIWPLAVGQQRQQEEEDGDCEESEGKKKRKGPSLFAVDRVLAIEERRARLLGLDAQPDAGNVTAQVLIVALGADVLEAV